MMSPINACLVWLRKLLDDTSRAGSGGRGVAGDLEQDKRIALEERKEAVLLSLLNWLVCWAGIPVLIFALVPELWGRTGLYIWIWKAALSSPVAVFVGGCYTGYDLKDEKGYNFIYWPGGVVVLVSEWIVMGIMIWIYGWPK